MADSEALIVRWAAPYGSTPVAVGLTVFVPGDWDFSLVCVGPDNGELELPPELVAQLPLPTAARLVLVRADRRLLATADGRFVLATASTRMFGDIQVE